MATIFWHIGGGGQCFHKGWLASTRKFRVRAWVKKNGPITFGAFGTFVLVKIHLRGKYV